MNEIRYTEICPKDSDFCQSTLMLEVADPTLIRQNGRNILYSTLVQRDAAKASCGTDVGFFCYVGNTLTEWAGPYLLCDNQTDADRLYAPKVVKSGDSYILVGRYSADDRNGVVVYRSTDPLGKFRFVSSFRLDIDCTPYVESDGKVVLYSIEDGKLMYRVISDDLMKLSAPTMLSDKLNPTSSPCVILNDDGEPQLIVPEEKGLTLIYKSEKNGEVKWKAKKLKLKLHPSSVSVYNAPDGSNMLLLGLNNSFALIPYTMKKGIPLFSDAILPYREEDIHPTVEEKGSCENNSKAKHKKKVKLSVNFSAVTAITIALLSAGIGIVMGLTTCKKK